LGAFLKGARSSRGLTLRAVEEATGVSNAYLSQLEGGKIQRPSPAVLYKLCHWYGASYATAMEYAGHPVPKDHPASAAGSLFASRLGQTTREEEDALLEYLEFLRSKRKRG
jgi:transcriptional regulator with XRE-family HTH domain